MIKLKTFLIILLAWLVFEIMCSSFFFDRIGRHFTPFPTIGKQTLGYVVGDSPIISFYNAREQKHLDDVKKLIRQVRYYVVFLLFISFFMLSGIALSLVIIPLSIILIVVLFFFRVFFVLFHSLFFASGSWIFDKKRELLSRVFPLHFWKIYSVSFISLLISLLVILFTLQQRAKSGLFS